MKETEQKVAISPEKISGDELPVGVRGYRRTDVDELLKRVAWDYRQVLRERDTFAEEAQRLKQSRDEVQGRIAELESGAAGLQAQIAGLRSNNSDLQAQTLELETRNEALERARAELEREKTRLQAELKSQRTLPAVAAPSEKPDDVAQTLLASVQKTVRELRESTRSQCDAIIKTARRRAAEIEATAQSSVKEASADVERLVRMQADLRDELRRTLESMLHEVQAPNGDTPRANLEDELAAKTLAPR